MLPQRRETQRSKAAHDLDVDQSSNKALTIAFDDSDLVNCFADLGYGVVPPQRSSDYFDKFIKGVAPWAKVLGDLAIDRK